MLYSEIMLMEKLRYASRTDNGGSNHALTSFLTGLEDIIGVHSIRVTGYASATARELGLPEKMLASLRTSALLHDIGKALIPYNILFKSSSLNDKEMAIIQQHPITGKRLLQEIEGYSLYAEAVLYHHEFYNGMGYPFGMSGEKIPLSSRIIAVADAYEAMTSDRPYRKGLSHREAVIRLKMSKYKQFDPEITDVFLKAIKSFSGNNMMGAETAFKL